MTWFMRLHASIVRLMVLQSLQYQIPRFIHIGICKESETSYQCNISEVLLYESVLAIFTTKLLARPQSRLFKIGPRIKKFNRSGHTTTVRMSTYTAPTPTQEILPNYYLYYKSNSKKYYSPPLTPHVSALIVGLIA